MNTASGKPLVSAVIPTRKRPALLRRAVKSVLRQTLKEVEVVVVIDGPDPATEEMLAGMEDERIRVIALPASVGGSDARNIGVQLAGGTWIGLLDDDDEWCAEKCASQLELAESSTHEDLLIVSKFLAYSAKEGHRMQPVRLPRPAEPLSEYMFSPRCGFQTSTFFCRRDLLLRVPFTSGLKGCQDLDWFLRVSSIPSLTLLICEDPLTIFHVPETRQSVSRGLDWRFRLAWGKSRRNLMTGRAYALFVVIVCATKALEERFSMKTFFRLMYECVFAGRPSPTIAGHLVALYVLSPQTRQKVRRIQQKLHPAKFAKVLCAGRFAHHRT
jgi:glycosyltransferase involved in cell wall biosynthesis